MTLRMVFDVLEMEQRRSLHESVLHLQSDSLHLHKNSLTRFYSHKFIVIDARNVLSSVYVGLRVLWMKRRQAAPRGRWCHVKINSAQTDDGIVCNLLFMTDWRLTLTAPSAVHCPRWRQRQGSTEREAFTIDRILFFNSRLMFENQLLDQRSDNKSISEAIVDTYELRGVLYVFNWSELTLCETPRCLFIDRDRVHLNSNGEQSIRSRPKSEVSNADEWRGGKTNNSFSRWNVIYNKHIALHVRVSFADIFFSLILKLFAHRTKIHKCFFFLFSSSCRCCCFFGWL